ncbi:hypothetical protein [Burkholderia gladioli]|uniref:hypothetical protein n=1 Tax=Burkholderia gladioli TaxID=28095 RepID=UPI00164004B7|nr:hypothetical protein [Burkholderia gladioli]
MSKHKHAKPVHPRQRNFPNDYTREDLIAQLVAMGAECYRQAEQIEALMQRICELEAEGSLLRVGGEHGADGGMDVNGYRRYSSDFLGRFDSIGLAEQGGYSCVAGRGDDVESTLFGRDLSAAPDMEPADIRLGDSVRIPVRRPLADSAPRPVFRVFDMSM